MHGVFILHTIISSVARNLFRFPFPSSFAKPFRGSTVPAFPAIRCFPFLAVGHAPFYRQRKRSLGSARDDDTGRTRFPAHTLYDTADIHSPTLSFRAQREIFFVPFFHDSFAKSFTGSTAYRLSCEKDPSAPLGMTIREKYFLSTAFAGYVG